MCVSVCVCVCVCDIDPGFSQSDGKAEWLIGARQSDLRQGEHTQSYSCRSNSSTVTAGLVWVMLYRLPCMRGQEQLDTQIHSGVTLLWHAVKKKKKTWEEERVGKAYWKGARHEGSIDNRWLMQDFPPLWEQWGHTSFGGVKTAIGAGEQAECGRFKHVARTRMVRSVPSLLFLPPRHTHSPFLLSSTSGSGFNPFKEGLGRTRESQLHADMHQREGKKERK